MKKYILLAAAAVTLAGCNSEDNYMDTPVAAQINATIGVSPLSRAHDLNWDKNDNIGVSMSGLHVNYKYTNADGGKAFEGTPMYFKNKVDPVTITAYYPFTGTECEAPGIIEASTCAEHQSADEQPKIDFLYAVQENVTGSHPVVDLSFSHRMSKLTLTFTNGNDATDVRKINRCTLEGLKLDGTFDPSTGNCACTSDAELAPLYFVPTSTPAETGAETTTTSASLIIFPQSPVDNTLRLKFSDTDGQDFGCNLTFPEALTPGNNYQFTIRVSKTAVTVNGTIEDWTPRDMTPDRPVDAGSED